MDQQAGLDFVVRQYILRSADVNKNIPKPKNVMRFKSTLINAVSPIANQQNSACRHAML
jgi:hypothetical protein